MLFLLANNCSCGPTRQLLDFYHLEAYTGVHATFGGKSKMMSTHGKSSLQELWEKN